MNTKILLIGVLANLLINGLSIAQSPNSFKYQAVLRDGNGNIRASVSTNVRIDILQGSATGTSVYAETFTAQTNAFGLMNLEIGNGTSVVGNFSTIDWSAWPYFVKVTVDGAEMGTSQLLSVPYALYAAKVANAFSGSYNDLTNKPTLFYGDYSNLTNKPTILNNSLNTTATGAAALINNLGNNNSAYGFEALNSNVAGANNTAIGVYALLSNYSGNYNTALGVNTLTGNYYGNYNTASGYYSLYNNTIGNYNTASGYNALHNNTSGNSNTAIGNAALNYNTTGYSNVAIGVKALYQNIDRGNLVAIGDSALFNNENGTMVAGYEATNNTAIGSKALCFNTRGYSNVASGSYALYSNTTGQLNVASGFQALYNNTTGNDNVASGFYSLHLNSIGSFNVACGYYAGSAITTGTSNTAVGSSSGPSDGTLTNTGAFGYGAQPTASNYIMIGNSSITWIGGHSAWNNTSDARFKTNVKENVPGLDFILKLKPVTFNWDLHKLDAYEGKSDSIYTHNKALQKARDDREKEICTGFLAQQVEEAAKQCGFNFNAIHKPENNKTPYSLSYAEFVVPLAKAMQEQQKQIEAQQKQIDELKQLVEKLTQK
jgi:hypothetical protein